ncbi:butyrate kinase [Ruminococcaceae bacterium OttesenSCG-928-O06]|nr:butyrate kinase [Ruminococcaceae bacterium OttesenSCG-928-O06]
MAEYMILSINPGSTSTKIGVFKGDKEVFKTGIQHAKEDLAKFAKVGDQKDYRLQLVLDELEKHGIKLEDIDAFAARGGSLGPIEGGVYAVNDEMLNAVVAAKRGSHPANLAAQMAAEMSKKNGKPAFIVNGPTVDEYDDLARLTGLKGVYRKSRGHALNQKEIGHRYAEKQGKKYEDMNLIIAHIGGGISVVAHRKGRMVDASDASWGEGPMAPTRTGTITLVDVLEQLKKGVDPEVLRSKSQLTGGWTDHLGTDNGMEVRKMIDEGNKYAKLVFDTTVYQICKFIGAMSIPLKGQVDAIVLTGGLSNDKNMTAQITEYVKFLAPVEVMAGEYELEGLAAGVARALDGTEEVKQYSEKDIFSDFEARHDIK